MDSTSALASAARPLVLLSLRQVSAKTGDGKTTIYNRIKTEGFPGPIKLGGGTSRWLEGEVDDWIRARIAERTASQAKARAPLRAVSSATER